MTVDRCPHCHAAVPAGAPWCTLCYADLRVPVPAAAPAEAAASPEPELVPPPVAVAQAAPPVALGERPAGWPCQACGALAPFEAMACPECGAAFLPSDVDVEVPWLGDPRRLSTTAKATIMIVGTMAVAAVLLLVFLVGGSFL